MSDLTPTVYAELRAIARARLASQKPGHTLQATALVNEAWLKLRGHFDMQQPGPAFFKTAAEAMRQVLIDHARGKARQKRGGGVQRELTDVAELSEESDPDQILALDEALCRLESQDETAAAVVKLRYFSGLSVGETAAALQLSERTVKREWRFARAWLLQQLSEPTG